MLLLAAFMLLIAIMSLTRRLSFAPDQLYSVDITGKKQVAISEIGSMRLSSMGNGMSRVEFVRWDGAPAFSRIRRAWPTTDLLHLAENECVGAVGLTAMRRGGMVRSGTKARIDPVWVEVAP